MHETVQEVRDDITLALPFLEAISRKTTTKYDDLVVAVLKVVVANDTVAQAVVEALGECPA